MKLPVKYDRRHTGTCILVDADGAEICSFGYDDEAKANAIEIAAKLNSRAALVRALEGSRKALILAGRAINGREHTGFIEDQIREIDAALALAKGE